MDSTVQSPNDNIRKIEDIIDIQKANGNYSVRQVAFNVPSDTDSGCARCARGEGCAGGAGGAGRGAAASLARSLDSGLSGSRSRRTVAKKKLKRVKRHTSPLPDAVSWPSDSDITVLRMKLRLTGSELPEAVGDIVPGDGLHRPDSSSMVNLATLMLQSQPPSKHSVDVEEYLLPLTSWEREPPAPLPEEQLAARAPPAPPAPGDCVLLETAAGVVAALAPVGSRHICDNLSSKDSGLFSRLSKKSKVAKFLRLYFCPCCTCLYEIEKMRDEPSVYLTKSKNADKHEHDNTQTNSDSEL